MRHQVLFIIMFLTLGTMSAQTKSSQLSLKKAPTMEGGTVYTIDKRNSELLLGSSTGVYWTTDYGINWNIIKETAADIPSNHVRIISEGNYVFTRDNSIYAYNRFTKTFVELAGLDTLIEIDAAITALCTAGERLLIGTGAGYIAEFNVLEKEWFIRTDSSGSVFRIVKGIVRSDSMYYAAVGKDIIKSEDGVTWIGTSFAEATNNDSFINSITVFENTPIVSTVNGVFRSTDNGNTWFSINGDLSESDIVMDVHSTGNNLVAIMIAGNILRFKKNDLQWEQVDFPEQFGYVQSVYDDNDGMYVGGYDQGIFHSANGRNGFAPMNRGFDEVSVNAFINFGSTLYAATNNGIYASSNNGENWYMSGKQGTRFQDCIVHKGTLLMASSDGIYRYEAQSGGWVFSGLPDTWCNSFLELDGKLLIATGNRMAFHQAKIYESTDGGAGWSDITTGDLAEESLTAIVRLDTSSTTIFAGTDFGLFRKPITGGEWTKVQIGNFLAQIVDFAIYKETIVAAIIQKVLIASTDNGFSWIAYNNGIPLGGDVGNINGVKEMNGTLYTLTDIGIYARTTDEDIWSKISDNFGTISIYNSGNNVVVGTKHAAYYDNKVSTGVDEMKEDNSIAVYPNPAKDLLTLQFNESQQLTDIRISDLLGRTVLSSHIMEIKQGNTISYDVSTLSAGQYIVHVGNRSMLFSVVK